MRKELLEITNTGCPECRNHVYVDDRGNWSQATCPHEGLSVDVLALAVLMYQARLSPANHGEVARG